MVLGMRRGRPYGTIVNANATRLNTRPSSVTPVPFSPHSSPGINYRIEDQLQRENTVCFSGLYLNAQANANNRALGMTRLVSRVHLGEINAGIIRGLASIDGSY